MFLTRSTYRVIEPGGVAATGKGGSAGGVAAMIDDGNNEPQVGGRQGRGAVGRSRGGQCSHWAQALIGTLIRNCTARAVHFVPQLNKSSKQALIPMTRGYSISCYNRMVISRKEYYLLRN